MCNVKFLVRVHSTHKGEETGGKPWSRKETTPLPMCAPHLRPRRARSQRFRSCAGASVFAENAGCLYPSSSAPRGPRGPVNIPRVWAGVRSETGRAGVRGGVRWGSSRDGGRRRSAGPQPARLQALQAGVPASAPACTTVAGQGAI